MTGVSVADTRSRYLCERLETMRLTNGFLTDCGRVVFRGKRKLNTDDVPCIVLYEGDDLVPDDLATEAKVIQLFGVEGHFPVVDVDHPNDDCHKFIADVKKILWARDDPGRIKFRYYAKLSYRGKSFGAREDGSKYASAILMIGMHTAEDLSNP